MVKIFLMQNTERSAHSMMENTLLGYEQFKEELRSILEERVGEQIEIYFDKMKKNNETVKEVMVFHKEDTNLTPMVHLKELYERYQEDEDLEKITDIIVDILETRLEIKAKEILGAWESVRHRVTMKLINFEWNREMLEKIPYKRFQDLAIVFQLKLKEETMGTVTTVIQDCLLKEWGISIEELYETAMDNLNKEKYSIVDIEEIIQEMFDIKIEPEDRLGMQYVLTNDRRSFGAAGILRNDLLEEFAEKIQGNFYILPSSLHELILVPEKSGFAVDELNTMVKTINQNEVEETERLSDSIYYYDKQKKKVLQKVSR